jgi:hypothetical protein
MPPRPSNSPSSYRPPTVVGLLVISMILPQTPPAILGHAAAERETAIPMWTFTVLPAGSDAYVSQHRCRKVRFKPAGRVRFAP